MRSLAEWLVLPLFLLPVALVAGFGLWAHERHARTLDEIHYRGAEVAADWLAKPDGRASWIPGRVIADFAPGGPARVPDADHVPFVHTTGRGEVRLEGWELGPLPWVVTDTFPAGLDPDALADPAIRLDIEVGVRPAEIAGVDEPTRALRELHARPDLDALRSAPLPASTKLFLLRGWHRQDPELPFLADAEGLLLALRELEHHGGDHGVARRAGAHPLGSAVLLSSGGIWPALLVPDGGAGLEPRTFAEGGTEDDLARLVWTFPPDETVPKHLWWEDRLEQPLSGDWRFVAKHGIAWWEAPFVERWIAPVVALAVAFLALPLALLVSMRRRRRQVEARVRFLNELAHDLRTPLTSLRLHADLLARGRADETKQKRYVSTVTREAAHLSGLLANLLDLTRLERGKRRFDTAPLSVTDAVDRALREFAATHPERAQDVAVEGRAEARVVADPTALGRCLANLLENAGKFTPPGAPIHVRWQEAGGQVRIAVADEGPGVPVSEERRVFDRYVRGKGPKSAGVPGTGLGLALVRELAEEMGGSIALLPSSKGAVFELRLPEAPDA